MAIPCAISKIESLNEEMERDEILREHSLDDVINIMVADHIKKNY